MAYSAEFRSQVVALASEIGATEAAAHHGISFRAVYGWAKDAGVDLPSYGQRKGREHIRLSPDRIGVHDDGTLDVTCWCERTVVRVPAEALRAGITDSCHRPWCAPHQRAA